MWGEPPGPRGRSSAGQPIKKAVGPGARRGNFGLVYDDDSPDRAGQEGQMSMCLNRRRCGRLGLWCSRAAAIAASLLTAGLPAAGATCESLAQLNLAAATVTTAQAIPAGSFTPPNSKPIPNLPAFCRVAGVLRPSSDSQIGFEVWMPATGWNGKFQGIGNGGYAGNMDFGGLAGAVSRGYAAAATDTGHQGSGIDASWALGHPEKILDFASRAIHETAVKGKQIVNAFYGSAPKRAYFSACSTGGRQALMEAQRYPEDYDGIISGAPANYWTHLMAGFVWNSVATGKAPGSYIPPAKLPALEAATLHACDALDGVKDGVINDPTRCKFDPAKLLCQGAETNACLTAPQVEALRKIYSGPIDAKGRNLFPGYLPGGETGPGGWSAWITGAAPNESLHYAFGTQFFKNMVYDNAAWDYESFDAGAATRLADSKMGPILNAINPDLSRFRARGGKLILYHGWSDTAIAPVNSIDYYKSVVAKAGAKEAATFLRLFMVPGMQHCGGGPGPDSFGQYGVAQGDAGHNLGRALEQWVEQGVAPDRIVATKFKPGTPPEAVRTRPLCRYPEVAKWKGSGSTDDAANFACVAPAKSGK